MNLAWAHLPMARARRVLIAVSNGRLCLLHLGEQKPSLERGEQSNGEVVRVDPDRESAVGMKGSESIGDGGSPLIEPSCDERSGLGVTLGELTRKRGRSAQPRVALVRFAAVSTMFRQVSTPFALLSACRLRLTMPVGLVVDDRLPRGRFCRGSSRSSLRYAERLPPP